MDGLVGENRRESQVMGGLVGEESERESKQWGGAAADRRRWKAKGTAGFWGFRLWGCSCPWGLAAAAPFQEKKVIFF